MYGFLFGFLGTAVAAIEGQGLVGGCGRQLWRI